MKNKIFYQRNSKGQYYAGISQTKAALLFITLIIVGVGTCYSLVRARSWNANDDITSSIGTSVYRQETDTVLFKHGQNSSTEPCLKNNDKYCDFTDTATKIRIYELTDGGKKAIKWYGETKEAIVTAYTSRVEETDASPCIAADGSDICARYAKGERICASNDYKLGTALDIQGLGRCIVSDRMNKRYTGTGRVDWYMGHDLTGARKWGIRQTSISLTQ